MTAGVHRDRERASLDPVVPPGTTIARERLAWVDLAKGLTMLLVVLAHVIYKHYVPLAWEIDLPIRRAWIELNTLFGPMRMPLFLLLSGFLASRALHGPWRQRLLRRVVNPYLLYVVWFVINVTVLVAVGLPRIEGLDVSTVGLLRNLVFPQTTLWYMIALAVFFLAAWLLRPLGVVVPLVGAFLLSSAVFAGWLVLPSWTGMTESIVRYFPLYLIGASLPSLPRRVAGWRGRPLVTVAVVGYLGIAVAYRVAGSAVPGFGPLAAVAGAAVGIMLAVRLATIDRLGPGLGWIGRRTLPIFVMHVPFLALLHALATGPAADVWAEILGSTAAAVIYPIVVTGAVTWACVATHAGLRRLGAGALFALPLGTPRVARSVVAGVAPGATQ